MIPAAFDVLTKRTPARSQAESPLTSPLSKLGVSHFPQEPDWTSGYELARNADLLLHDAQYTPEEYQPRVGWGHSTMDDTLQFAELAAVKKLLFFHHAPSHTDEFLEQHLYEAMGNKHFSLEAGVAAEGNVFQLPE